MYSKEAPGTVRARSEYTYQDIINNDELDIESITMPVFCGMEAMAMTTDRVTRSMTRAAKGPENAFGSASRTSPKEGGGTQQKTSSKPLPKLSKASRKGK